MSNSRDYSEIDVMQIFQALWHRLWVIILSAILGGAILFSYATFLITPKYEAQAMMYVNNSSISVGGTSFSISNAELTAAQSLVDTYIIILNSRATLNAVISKADLDYSYKELKEMLSAESVNNTEVFSITITSEDPQEAELIANTIVDVLPGKISDVVDGSSVRTVDFAVVPSEKASPNITMFTAIGILIGVAASCMLLIIKLLGDTLIHNEDYLTDTYELPVLCVVPNLYDGGKSDYYSSYETKTEVGATK